MQTVAIGPFQIVLDECFPSTRAHEIEDDSSVDDRPHLCVLDTVVYSAKGKPNHPL